MPRAIASPFANSIPTRSEPTSPGPSVTATASICSMVVCAVSRACRTTRGSSVMCARDASSGTTPPYSRWTSCAAAMLERMRPSSTTAAPVSSQEVSMPRMRMGGVCPSLPLHHDSRIRQHRRAIVLDFEEPAGDVIRRHPPAGILHLELPLLEGRDQRRVVREHPEIAFGAGHLKRCHLRFEEKLLWGHEPEEKRVLGHSPGVRGYAAEATPICSAFWNTSSIAPT